HRYQRRAGGQLLADGQRRFAVGVAAVTRTNARPDTLLERQGCRRELAVVEVIRQRDLLLIDVVARLERDLLAERKARADRRASGLAVVGDVVRSQGALDVQVEADAEPVAHEERLGKRQ